MIDNIIYETPDVEIVEVKLEKGFAVSVFSTTGTEGVEECGVEDW